MGRARYADGRLVGEVRCSRGGRRSIVGTAFDRSLSIVLLPPGTAAPDAGPPPPGTERLSLEKRREAGSVFAAFFIAVAVVCVLARLLGMAAVALGQPRVIGEVVAGLALGPSLLGAISPAAADALFPEDIIPYLEVAAQLGLIFYMFLIGLELDPRQIGRRAGQIALISNASVAVPMALGIAIALPVYTPAGARHRLPPVRFVRRDLDVDHGLPGARADPRRAPDAQAPDRRRGAGRGRV